MKKIYNLLVLLAGVLCFVACSDDNDSNPTLRMPTQFVLNTPAYVSGIYDLENTESVLLTCTQPDYGYTAAVVYAVEVSLTEGFDTYKTLPSTYTTARMEVSASEMAVALTGLLEKDEDEFPITIPVYIRLSAALTNGEGEITSNVIELPEVKCYYALDSMVMPEEMYLIGNVTGNWSWTSATKMIPVNDTPGKFWAIQYLGLTEAGDKAEIKFSPVPDWGEDFGFSGANIDDTSLALTAASEADGGNILIGNPGWYLVVVTTAIEGREYVYEVNFLEPDVYLTGDPSGGFDEFNDARKFTVPNGLGEFVSPLTVAEGEMRICVKLEDIEWWKTEFMIFDGKIEYRGNGGDQERVNVGVGQRAYLNFTEGTGRIGN
ncbi:MAG: SusF/SusE family outer membrane protein [Bacteroides sp.]|nr:SusF/SusE family outer membrane protein [Bacteroides sp.]